ncbi:Thioredoxin domain-containing protein [Artemisia annua]|uniref:Thioredoxin domain-containing protein n=1 Tax=Artemisia annua TaxID=35608 RepID=A0A2U1P0M0_ARTAN|nr:Thioredoxin domain-containing protein [Artemisia annua]
MGLVRSPFPPSPVQVRFTINLICSFDTDTPRTFHTHVFMKLGVFGCSCYLTLQQYVFGYAFTASNRRKVIIVLISFSMFYYGGVTTLKDKIGFRGLDRVMASEEALTENVSYKVFGYYPEAHEVYNVYAGPIIRPAMMQNKASIIGLQDKDVNARAAAGSRQLPVNRDNAQVFARVVSSPIVYAYILFWILDETYSPSAFVLAKHSKLLIRLTNKHISRLTVNFVLVLGYAPWDVRSAELMPRFADAATKLRELKSGVLTSKIDAERYSKAAAGLGIKGYPTLLLFVNRSSQAYTGGFWP